jgi:hypothetical protein
MRFTTCGHWEARLQEAAMVECRSSAGRVLTYHVVLAYLKGNKPRQCSFPPPTPGPGLIFGEKAIKRAVSHLPFTSDLLTK